MMKARITKALSRCCRGGGASASESVDTLDMARTARVFKALGDETRLSIVAMLGCAGRPLCVCEIEPRFELSQPTISHHLKVLRDSGLVETERRGTWVHYSLARETLAFVSRFHEAVSQEGMVGRS